MRRFSLVEALLCVTMTALTLGAILPQVGRSLRARRVLAQQASDLDALSASVDRLRGALRRAKRVVAGAGAHRTSGECLVLERLDGAHEVYRLERVSNASWLVRYALPASPAPGAQGAQTLLARADGLALRFDALPVTKARAVAFDLVLPARLEGARPRRLSTRARVGGPR
ncbi:MAG TPA: hypothetical protein DEA08_19515 [Planctomycetes bacterium]|nr:hypothetical protein [Planctomycetota bacterium]